MMTDAELPYHDYRGTRLPRLDKVYKGLDGQVHGWIGRYRRRASLDRRLGVDAHAIVTAAQALRELDDETLKQRMISFRERFRRQRESEQERRDALAALCAAVDRTLGLRPYAVQVMGALALHRGYLIEMATGEGKSLTAALAAILAGWSGHPCHLLTVNDYLAGRDAEFFAPLYRFYGVTAAAVSEAQDEQARSRNYRCDLVYTTAKQLLADFLRDRLRLGAHNDPGRRLLRRAAGFDATPDLVLRGLDTVIVDEADSVLIDEAVSPMIISRQEDNPGLRTAVVIASRVASRFRRGKHYRADPRYRSIRLTAAGEDLLATIGPDDVLGDAVANTGSGVDNALAVGLWSGRERRRELLRQALTAREFYHPGQQFVIDDGKVVLVDEFTDRLAPQRSWGQGLHQAIEAGQGVELSAPNETLLRLSFQRFFRLFRCRSGMSGTVAEGAEELWRIYRLSVFPIPENRPCRRQLQAPRLYADAVGKWRAIVAEVETVSGHGKRPGGAPGRPVLIGTRNVAESERLAGLLDRAGIPYQLLNARHPEAEAGIIAAAGEPGRITIATNMAGRGTDIALGPTVVEQGGLHVIVSECHESSRIDRQLMGRGARQGDPGSARLYGNLEDELLQRFAGRAARLLKPALQYWLPGTSAMLQRLLLRAQRRAEAQAFRQRRGVLDYDTTRMRVTGHLWQGRFGSVVMDEEHLANAIRYVTLNPVRARLVERVQEWPWSSANAHLSGSDDELVTVAPVLERYGDLAAFLDQEESATAFRMLRQSETTGRPLGL